VSGALAIDAEGLAQAVLRGREVQEWLVLMNAGPHGHEYAIDALLCATALSHPGRITILTSDIEDIELLTADHPRVTAEKV